MFVVVIRTSSAAAVVLYTRYASNAPAAAAAIQRVLLLYKQLRKSGMCVFLDFRRSALNNDERLRPLAVRNIAFTASVCL